MIPKILLHISKDPLPQYVKDMWQKRIDNSWQVHWFDDAKILTYFKDNPLPEFSNIERVFNSFERGAHKADLFRYYFMYLNGGVFVDSDAMTHVSLNEIVNTGVDHFFTVSQLEMNDLKGSNGCMFNGFYGCAPKSSIVYKLLQNCYTTSPKTLNRFYLYFTCMMYDIVTNDNPTNTTYYYEDDCSANGQISYIRDNNRVVCSHYNTNKIIPDNIEIL